MNLILKKQADLFFVRKENGETFSTKARKNLKKEGLFVGDRVVLDEENLICGIAKRKNLLIRPPLANLDRMFIVLSPVPKPDFYMVDKLLVFCAVKQIEPIICINKSDLDQKYCKNVKKIYGKIANTIVFSTLDDSVIKLLPKIKGVCALAGQSAVGKSSIINALVGKSIAKVDTFSKKIERGKQTTRTVELYQFGKNNFLADTAGFSKLDENLLEVDEHELKAYYPEFLQFAGGCKYSSCEHLSCKNCGVVKAVQEGSIDKIRYENYLKLHECLKNIKKY